MPRYNPTVVEAKWQRFWEEHRSFAAPRLPAGEKMYVLDMFPYPSGDGLHVGHPEGYTATDIVCRFHRMLGHSVMHPMGWDAFGLPAEQHAKKTGTHPRTTTEQNMANFRRQLKMLGFSYDWDRELATTDLEYFRWTQFIFLALFDTWFDLEQQKGRPIAELPIPEDVQAAGEEAVRRYQDEYRLAYQLEAPVNWCPALGTVLANEEVIGGLSERGGHPVVRIPLRQWMLRITAYADRLEKDLDMLDWPESIKLLQRNWIGRSTGAEVDFFIGTQTGDDGMPSQDEFEWFVVDRIDNGFRKKPGDNVLRVYTTRPDTLFGATYMVIAPEHPFVQRLAKPQYAAAVEAYCRKAAAKSDLDRTDLAKEKTGVFTGSYAVNPVNGKAMPIWVADYVLISYGTGAIMAVPAHDTRDFEFAQEYDLPIIAVVDPGEAAGKGTGTSGTRSQSPREQLLAGRVAFIADGTAINSGRFTGLATAEFKRQIIEDLANKGLGREAVNYRLRDWLFSRQHFWGEPFPILHELDAAGRPTGMVRALTPEELPLDLPAEMKFDAQHDTPEPPLEKAPADWLYVTEGGKRYKRETNTMPQWAGSCWYFLRFLDPHNDRALVDPQIEKAWMPVDLYVGGAEHAVLHLLYARFWHKVLFDRGYVSTPEPFRKLVNQGMILGEAELTGYQDGDGKWVTAADVEERGGGTFVRKSSSMEVKPVILPKTQVEKRGNVIYLKAVDTLTLSDAAEVDSRAHKMSKSRGNVVNPDQVVADYGADSLRLYEMFMGPLEAVKPWSMDGVSGVRGFLDRFWRMIVDERADAMQLNPALSDAEPTREQNRVLHKTIQAVTRDIQQLSFNTAIARLMEATNFFLKEDSRPRSIMERLVLLVSPFAPHVAEELWQLLRGAGDWGLGAGDEGTGFRVQRQEAGGTFAGGYSPAPSPQPLAPRPQSLAYAPWPKFEEALAREDTIEVPVQINGKLRAVIQVPAGADRTALEQAARAQPKIAEMLSAHAIQKVIVVPGRMVNFVVR